MTDTALNLLIVDDDALLRNSLFHTLSLAGYRVRCANGGHSALSELQREIPDLLLSDLNMPGLSGFELLTMVRGRFPGIQVIAMSGAYFGDNVPPGVFADAFYEKGRGGRSLLQIVADVAGRGRSLDVRNGRRPQVGVSGERSGSDDQAIVAGACCSGVRSVKEHGQFPKRIAMLSEPHAKEMEIVG